MLEGDDGVGQLVVAEGVFSPLTQCPDPRLQHRVVWRCERKLVDDHAGQRRPANVDALPETVGAQQHRVARRPEFIQQPAARRRALNHQGIVKPAPQQLRGPLQGAVTGKQDKGPSPARLDDRHRGIYHGARVVRGIGHGHGLRQV